MCLSFVTSFDTTHNNTAKVICQHNKPQIHQINDRKCVNMQYDSVLKCLQNLINYKPSQAELCKILNIKQSTMSNRAVRNSSFNHNEIETLENHYGVILKNTENTQEVDIVKIPYWENLPDELKHPEYTYVPAQKISIEQGWGTETNNLRIIPMIGNKMTNYWYPMKDNDILIVDISHNYIMGSGVYFATSRNDTHFWIREMQVLINNDIEFKGFSPSGETTKTLSKDQLDEAGFKLIGKVIKNVSFRL